MRRRLKTGDRVRANAKDGSYDGKITSVWFWLKGYCYVRTNEGILLHLSDDNITVVEPVTDE